MLLSRPEASRAGDGRGRFMMTENGFSLCTGSIVPGVRAGHWLEAQLPMLESWPAAMLPRVLGRRIGLYASPVRTVVAVTVTGPLRAEYGGSGTVGWTSAWRGNRASVASGAAEGRAL